MSTQKSKEDRNALKDRALLVRGLKSKGVSAELMVIDIRAIYAMSIVLVALAIPAMVTVGVCAVQGINTFKVAPLPNPARIWREMLRR